MAKPIYRLKGGHFSCTCSNTFVATRNNQYECSECCTKRQRQRRQNNPGLSTKYDRTWREKHPDRAKRRWERRRNSEPTLRQSLMRILVKARASISNPKTPGRRGFKFDLTVEFLLGLWEKQQGLCALSGMEMTIKHGQYADLCAVSIDRIDCDVGYVTTNVHLACRWANIGRGRHTVAEFKEMIGKLKG